MHGQHLSLSVVSHFSEVGMKQEVPPVAKSHLATVLSAL